MKKFLITLGIVLLSIAIVVGVGYFFVRQTINTHTYRPIDASATQADAVIFEIESGMFPATVVERLYEEGFIRHEFIANQIIRFNNWGAIQEGEYEIHQGMSLYEMFARFIEGDGVYENFNYIIIPEGELMTGIANRVAEALDMDADYLLRVWSDVDFLEELIEEYWFLTDEILKPELYYPLEGYITPIRHDIPEGLTDVRALTRVMLDMTQQQLLSVQPQIENHEMAFHEILTFASIIEGETQDSRQRAMVAGVFQNRLDIDMRLETDVTAQYLASERQTHVTYDLLAVDSPFNTYLYPGLPPGPLNSPSIASIGAVMNPESHEYLFFISDMFGCAGEVGGKFYFTNYPDHEAFRQAYLEPSYEAGESLCDPNVQVN